MCFKFFFGNDRAELSAQGGKVVVEEEIQVDREGPV